MVLIYDFKLLGISVIFCIIFAIALTQACGLLSGEWLPARLCSHAFICTEILHIPCFCYYKEIENSAMTKPKLMVCDALTIACTDLWKGDLVSKWHYIKQKSNVYVCMKKKNPFHDDLSSMG